MNNSANALNVQPHFAKPLHPAAVIAHNRGWCVFPISSSGSGSRKGKTPLFDAKHTNGRRWGNSNDPDYVNNLFAHRRCRDAYIGLACGPDSKVWVVDIDTAEGHGPGHDGPRSLAALIAKHGPLPRTLTSRSPSGGWQHVFRYPADGRKVVSRALRDDANNVIEGIDIKAWGGYVVIPPSKGRTWENERAPIAEAPSWLLDLVCERPQAPAKARPRSARLELQRAQPRVPPPTPTWLIEAMTQDSGRGLSINPRDSDDTELKIQYALDAIPRQPYLDWMNIGGMIACALCGVVEDDGYGLWSEWSGPGGAGDRTGSANACADKWDECLRYTAYGRDGSSIFRIANRYDTERRWLRAYEAEYAKTLRGRRTG
jgi:hypothetical protein